MEWIFLACGILILKILLDIHEDYKFQRKMFRQSFEYQPVKLEGPDYEEFESQLETILNLSKISTPKEEIE